MRRKSNFLIVNESEANCYGSACHSCKRLEHWNTNSFLGAAETTVKQIEDAFKDFTNREGIAIVMISQFVSLDAALCF